jgi:hypothetical protein
MLSVFILSVVVLSVVALIQPVVKMKNKNDTNYKNKMKVKGLGCSHGSN